MGHEASIYNGHLDRGSGAVGYSIGPASGGLGVRILTATDVSRKNR